MAFFVAFLVLVLSSAIGYADIHIEPENPRWGDTLDVRADLEFPRNTLTPTDRVFLTFVTVTRGLHDSSLHELKWDGTHFRGRVVVPEGPEYASLNLSTPEQRILYSTKFLPLDRSGERPPGAGAIGLHMGVLDRDHWEPILEQELTRYPDLAWMYREVWGLRYMVLQNISPDEILRQVQRLESNARSAELLRTLSYGYWLAGEAESAVDRLREVCQRFPESPWAVRTLADAVYRVETGSLEEYKPELDALKRDVINTAPENPSLRSRASVDWFTSTPGIHLTSVETVFEGWVAEDPKSPFPYYLLAEALSRAGDPSRAEELVSVAIELHLSPDRPHAMEYPVGLALRLRSDLKVRREALADALVDIKVAQNYTLRFWPDDLNREAAIWKQLGRPRKAQEVALEAYRQGSPEAEPFLRDLFSQRTGAEDGFDEYFLDLLTGAPVAVVEEVVPAPRIQGKTLEGEIITNESLEGEIVVINFWFTTCGPCIAEIPRLNDLVDQFRGRVRFLALATDPEPRVREFLASRKFEYDVVANAAALAESFEIMAYPTHLVLNREGDIVLRRRGSARQNLRDIDRLVRQLLDEGAPTGAP